MKKFKEITNIEIIETIRDLIRDLDRESISEENAVFAIKKFSELLKV